MRTFTPHDSLSMNRQILYHLIHEFEKPVSYLIDFLKDVYCNCNEIAFHVHTSRVFSKKYISSSDESIENLIYYKDCNHRAKVTEAPQLLRQAEKPAPAQPDCPFPKMCCSMSCGNECGSSQSVLGRQMEPLQNMQSIQPISNPPRQPALPIQPQLLQRGRKKKMKPLSKMIPPIGGRRDSGFTKDRIKSLISQDQDIRKILKDLVRVTMQKVDLLEMVNSRRSAVPKNSETSLNSEED